MKALTNILNYILLLMMILIASCTEDTAEVDDLVRGEEYVTVRMQVPGMKNATTRADEAEDNLTSVWALVFRDGKLVSKTEVTTSTLIPSTSTTGTFNLSRPKVEDVIHFLGNVPNGVTLPDVGDDESALCNLETGDRENLSYWGKATYNGGDITVNLYRHLAKIEIAPDPNECTFPEDELFIAGLVNANTKGKLVPYDDENGAFNFDLSDENYGGNYDYCTVPAEPNPLDKTPLLDNNGAGFKNWLYVFEHENPETADGLYVICKIGKCYYKVALKSDGDGVKPYNIIRNHKYTILVNDLDEVVYNIPDSITGEKEIENYKYQQALKSDPINLKVKEMKDVTLTITPSATSLNYDDNVTSAEQVTVTVGGLQNVVETLTFTAPGYTILSDYAESAGEGVFTITDTSKTEIDFTFTLTDQSQAGEISVTGEGDLVSSINTDETSIQWNKRQEVNGEIVMWEGSVKMHVPDGDSKHAAKIPIPYSFFFDAEGNATVLAGSKVHVDYSGTGWFVAYTTKGEWQAIWNIMDDGADLVLTEELLTTLKENRNTVWNVDAAFLLQGGGPTMTKVTLIPAKERIEANITNGATLYYDSNDAQVVTVNVTVPDGVETLTIGGAENFAIVKTAGDGTLNGTGTTYTMGSERTATFTFTLLNAQNVTSQQTITFSDPSETVNAASVAISMAQTPKVTFTNTGTQTITLGNPLSVVMNVPEGKTLSDFRIEVTSESDLTDFVVTQNSTSLTLDKGVYNTTSGVSDEQTFTFTPSATGTYTITFSGEGTDVNMPDENNRTINLTVNAAAVTDMSVTAVNGDSTIDLDSGDINVTFTLTKPSSVGQLNIGVKDANSTNVKNNFSITADGQSPWNNNDNQDDGYYYNVNNNSETVTITVALKNGFNTAGTYTITISDYNKTMSATATITIKKTPTVSFSNTSDKILYWNNGSPTSFDVEMTDVPNGESVTLNITNASAFTITASNGTLSATNNGYSYTGGNTTFTITPKSAESVNETTPYSITFTDANDSDGVIVPEKSISVKVMNEKPAQGEDPEEETVWNEGPLALNWSNFAIDADWFEGAPEGDVQMYVYFSNASQFEVRVDNNGSIGKYHDVNLNNKGFGQDPYMGNFDGLNGKISIVVPAEKRSVSFYISGSITITEITVEK